MTDKQKLDEKHNQHPYYEIRLTGHLDARWAGWLEGLTITLEEDGDTLLTVPVVDQAALHGLLKKVRDLGIPLISISPLEHGCSPAHRSGQADQSDLYSFYETHPYRSKKETKMKTLQKMGGFAALYEAAAYIVGMIGFLTVVNVSGVADPAQQVALMAENLAFLYILYLFVYVVWGIFMVILALALYERLKAASPAIMQTATIFGIFWGCVIIISGMIHNVGMQNVVDLYGIDPTQAGTVWLTIDSVLGGLAGSNEAIGGIWILLLSWAALRKGEFSRVLNYLGVVIGIAGILSIVPALAEIFIYIFALGQIVWFIWLGISMLRSGKSVVA
jgi:hypothetical protein